MHHKKRYLLSSKYNINSIKIDYEKKEIEEYYTYISRCKTVKYQHQNDNYFKIIVLKNRCFDKQKIDKKEFSQKKRKKLSHIIKKSVYFLSNGSVLTIYKEKLDDIKILKFNNLDDVKSFIPYFEKDVSELSMYSNLNIALYGNPLNNKNVYQLMKRIKNLENLDMKNIIKKNLSVENAVRVKLYELYLKLLQDRLNILKNDINNANNIERYSKRLKTIIDLLKEYGKYFDEELVVKVKENLEYIYQKREFIKKINSIKSNLKRYEKCINDENFIHFLSEEDQKLTKDVEDFIHFLQTREYSIILKQLELLIKESSVELNDNEVELTIKNALKKSFKKRYKKVKKAIKKYIDCEDEESFEKILKRVNLLDSINREFGFLCSDKIYYKRKKLISLLQRDIERFLVCIENIKISKSNIKDASELECLINSFEKERKKILKKFKKSVVRFKSNSKLFIT